MIVGESSHYIYICWCVCLSLNLFLSSVYNMCTWLTHVVAFSHHVVDGIARIIQPFTQKLVEASIAAWQAWRGVVHLY